MSATAHEIWTKWTPVEGIPDELVVERVVDDWEGFRVLLQGRRPTTKMLRLTFESHFLYRSLDGGSVVRSLAGRDPSQRWPLYTIGDSILLRSFFDESAGYGDGLHLVHYRILTSEQMIDVLDSAAPIAEWLGS